MNIIELNQVYFSYDGIKPILEQIDLKIKTGSIVAVMGSSGSGKTTLLKLISGQIKATAGVVKVNNQILNQLDSNKLQNLRKNIGYLFQFGALFTDLTVKENIAFALTELTSLSSTVINKIVALKLNSVGLFGTEAMYPHQLSGGMARRVAIARATALDPSIMLYDEPFTGLDPISLNIVAMLIKRLAQSLHQSVIVITHDVATTLKIADYVYFMAQGKIINFGTPAQIKSSTDPAVLQFIQGLVDGPIAYKYLTTNNYAQFIGC